MSAEVLKGVHHLNQSSGACHGEGPLDELVDDYEKRLIEDALFLFSGRVSEAADYLNVPRKKLYLRMKKYGLDKECFKPVKPGRG